MAATWLQLTHRHVEFSIDNVRLNGWDCVEESECQDFDPLPATAAARRDPAPAERRRIAPGRRAADLNASGSRRKPRPRRSRRPVNRRASVALGR